MAHWRLLYPSNYLCAADLRGKDATVEISEVSVKKLVSQDGKQRKEEEKVVVSFKGKKKQLVLNKTNAKSIAKQLGPMTEEWAGQKVTLFPTTCMAFGEQVECIRVREGK